MANITLIYPPPTAALNSFVEWFKYINTITNDIFGVAIVATFFIIMFVAMSRSNFGRNETEKVIVASCFVTMLLSFFFMIVDLVEIQVVLILTIATIFSVLLVKKDRGTF